MVELASEDAFLDELGLNPAQKATVIRSAREYEERGCWVTFDTLAYEAAEEGREWDSWTPSTLPRFVGGAWTGESVTLTALGLLAAGSAPATAEALFQLVRISAKRKIELRDEAELGRDILISEFGWSEGQAVRAYELFQMVPGLSGGGRGGEDWQLSIFRGALDYRSVETVADLLKVLMARVEQDRRFVQQHAYRPPQDGAAPGDDVPPDGAGRRWRHWVMRSGSAMERPWLKNVGLPLATTDRPPSAGPSRVRVPGSVQALAATCWPLQIWSTLGGGRHSHVPPPRRSSVI